MTITSRSNRDSHRALNRRRTAPPPVLKGEVNAGVAAQERVSQAAYAQETVIQPAKVKDAKGGDDYVIVEAQAMTETPLKTMSTFWGWSLGQYTLMVTVLKVPSEFEPAVNVTMEVHDEDMLKAIYNVLMHVQLCPLPVLEGQSSSTRLRP